MGFRVQCLWFRVWGLGFRVWGLGFRVLVTMVSGFGFRVYQVGALEVFGRGLIHIGRYLPKPAARESLLIARPA